MLESLEIAVLTVSDTRTLETDTSGQFLCDSLEVAGHHLADRCLEIDDVYRLRAKVFAMDCDTRGGSDTAHRGYRIYTPGT